MKLFEVGCAGTEKGHLSMSIEEFRIFETRLLVTFSDIFSIVWWSCDRVAVLNGQKWELHRLAAGRRSGPVTR